MSDHDVADQSLDARISDLEAIVDKLQLDKLAIFGVRNSGFVALEYARRHPKDVCALVLDECFESGSVFWETRLHRDLERLMNSRWTMFTDIYALLIHGWDSAADSETAGELSAYIRDCISQSDFLLWREAERDIDLSNRVRSIDVPSLVSTYNDAGSATEGSRLWPEMDKKAVRQLAYDLPESDFIAVDTLDRLLVRMDEFLNLHAR